MFLSSHFLGSMELRTFSFGALGVATDDYNCCYGQNIGMMPGADVQSCFAELVMYSTYACRI